MTYFESATGIRVTRKRALEELDRHGIIDEGYTDFDNEVKPGKDGLYSASEVLEWLGY